MNLCASYAQCRFISNMKDIILKLKSPDHMTGALIIN